MTTNETLPTILLVEDDSSDAALIRRGFTKAGVLNEIVHLTNGDDALAYLAGEGKFSDRTKSPLPGLILLDLKLPGMHGLQLMQWMRTRPEVRRIPLVVLTGSQDSETVNMAYDLGANSYLVKPGTVADITQMIVRIQRYWMELNEPPRLVLKADASSR
jgi:CheY-like chemotaxis protein